MDQCTLGPEQNGLFGRAEEGWAGDLLNLCLHGFNVVLGHAGRTPAQGVDQSTRSSSRIDCRTWCTFAIKIYLFHVLVRQLAFLHVAGGERGLVARPRLE